VAIRKYATAKLEVITTPLSNIPDGVISKNASVVKMSGGMARFGSFTFQPQPGFIYTRVRAISARVNKNYDGFPSKELEASYKTFLGRPVFVNHTNHDPKRARGVVIASEYFAQPDDHWIGLLTEVDAVTFPKLARDLINGDIDSVSMGCDVARSICSYCSNVATTPEEFCDHVRNYKGQTLPRVIAGTKEDVLVYESCHGLNFFELSYVFDPADETAVMQEVMVPGGLSISGRDKVEIRTASVSKSEDVEPMPSGPDAELQWAQRLYPSLREHTSNVHVGYGEMIAPPNVDTLRDDDNCPQCGNEGFDGQRCSVCDYIQPPDEMQDPDVDRSKDIKDQVEEKTGGGDADVVVIIDKDDDDDVEGEDKEEDTEDDEFPNGQEGVRREGEVTAPKLTARARDLAERRLLEAQRRLADMSTVKGLGDGAEAVEDTPPAEGTEVTTDNVRGDANETSVQNLDDTKPGTQLVPDERTDVTDLSSDDWHYTEPRTSKRRPARQRSTRKSAEVADDPAEAAEPDRRVDVEAPVANMTDDYAQDSQYRVDEYEDNQSKDKAEPVLDNDQIWMPRDSAAKAAPRVRLARATTAQQMQLADMLVDLGLIDRNDKYAALAKLENMPEIVANFGINLLQRVAQVYGNRLPGQRVARTQVPKLGSTARVPSMAQPPRVQASYESHSLADDPTDVLLTL